MVLVPNTTRHGAKIDALIKERGTTLSALARRINMDPSQLRRIKNQPSNPAVGTLRRIAAGLDVPVSELLEQGDEFRELET